MKDIFEEYAELIENSDEDDIDDLLYEVGIDVNMNKEWDDYNA
jgi:hypothetical protein